MAKGLFDSTFSSISDRIMEFKTQLLQEFIPIYYSTRQGSSDKNITDALIECINNGKARNYDAFCVAAQKIAEEGPKFSVRSLDLTALYSILTLDTKDNPFKIKKEDLKYIIKKIKATRNYSYHKNYQEDDVVAFQNLVGALYDIDDFFSCLYHWDESKKTSYYSSFIGQNRKNLAIIRDDLFNDFIEVQRYIIDIEQIRNMHNPYDAYEEMHKRNELHARDTFGRRDSQARFKFLRACEIAELEPAYEYIAGMYMIKNDPLKAKIYEEKSLPFRGFMGTVTDYERRINCTKECSIDEIALTELSEKYPDFHFKIEKYGNRKRIYCYKKSSLT